MYPISGNILSYPTTFGNWQTIFWQNLKIAENIDIGE